MAAPSLALDPASRRRVSRRPINISLDVITLQSGIPYNMPGRCTDLSEAGLGAVVAGQLTAGQTVAVELRLPNVGLPLRARAQVRYQERLRYGLQFVGLSIEQREKIRYWSLQNVPEPSRIEIPSAQVEAQEPPASALANSGDERRTRKLRARRRRFYVLAVVALAFAALAWWQWQKVWNELETDAPVTAESQPSLPLRLSPEIMERQIAYKVDPAYPEAARAAGTHGLVVLDAVIAPDGTVTRLRPLAGADVLVQSALDAIYHWRYTPYRVDGRAVAVETTVSIDFRRRLVATRSNFR
jgi:TonB family protein